MKFVPTNARRGLTLVELLLAIILLALLMVAVFQLLDRSLSVWRKGETRRALLEQASSVASLLARDLRGLESGTRGDLLVEWVRFDTDGDGIAESKWPRLRLVRQASAGDVARLEEAGRAHDRKPRTTGSGDTETIVHDDAPLVRSAPGLIEIVWLVAPASLVDKDARAEGILWRGERLCDDKRSRSFFANDFFGSSNRPPAGATEEVTTGVLWMQPLLAAQTSIVHEGWKIGPGLDCAATAWDAWSRKRPGPEIHPWNAAHPGMPPQRDRPILPRRVQVELEIERPADRLRRTRLVAPIDLAASRLSVDDPDRITHEEGAFVLVDAEWMQLGAPDSRGVAVTRGARGTTPLGHDAGSMVHWGQNLVLEVTVPTAREDWNP